MLLLRAFALCALFVAASTACISQTAYSHCTLYCCMCVFSHLCCCCVLLCYALYSWLLVLLASHRLRIHTAHSCCMCVFSHLCCCCVLLCYALYSWLLVLHASHNFVFTLHTLVACASSATLLRCVLCAMRTIRALVLHASHNSYSHSHSCCMCVFSHLCCAACFVACALFVL